MMIALLSPTLGGGAALPDWIPSGAKAFLDFVNGRYFAGNQVRDVSAILGGGFDASQIIPSSGMLVAYENENRPAAIGALYDDLATALLNGGTLAFDLDFGNSPYGPIIGFYDAASEDEAFDWVTLYANSNALTDGYDLSLGESLGTTGEHDLIVTLNSDVGDGSNREYSWQLDGGPVETQTVPYSNPFPTSSLQAILIGHDGNDSNVLDNVYIRSITVYYPPPLAIRGLPALDAMVGLAYASTINATGGLAPYTFAIVAGTLPDGLSLDSSTGEITGTPTGTGVSSGIVVRITDDNGDIAETDAFAVTVRNSLIRLVDQKSQSFGSTSATLSDVNFGQDDATRVIAIVATGKTSGIDSSISAMTIGGDTATGVQTAASFGSAAIYFAEPTGESGDVDVTVSASSFYVHFDVYAIYGVSAAAFDSDSLDTVASSFDLSVNADDDGIVLAGMSVNNRSAAATWSGLAEVTETGPEGVYNVRSSTAVLMNGAATTIPINAATSTLTRAWLVAVSFPGA